MSNRKGLCAVLLVLGASLLTGCAADGDKGRVISSDAASAEQRAQAEINRVKSNPNMSPAAKEAALRGMEQRQRDAKMASAYATGAAGATGNQPAR